MKFYVVMSPDGMCLLPASERKANRAFTNTLRDAAIYETITGLVNDVGDFVRGQPTATNLRVMEVVRGDWVKVGKVV